jgi:tetratricopeptide (TPR) repeat protein/predicted Ser/Thr protein kinase
MNLYAELERMVDAKNALDKGSLSKEQRVVYQKAYDTASGNYNKAVNDFTTSGADDTDTRIWLQVVADKAKTIGLEPPPMPLLKDKATGDKGPEKTNSRPTLDGVSEVFKSETPGATAIAPADVKAVEDAVKDAPPGTNELSVDQIEQQIQALPDRDKGAAGQVLLGQEAALEGEHSRDERRFVRVGERLNALGRPKDALRSFDHAVDLKPDDSGALSQRARAKAMLGDKDGALGDARKTLALDPRNMIAQLIVGHADSLGKGAGKFKAKNVNFGAGSDPEALDRGTGQGSPVGAGAAGAGQGAGTLGTIALAGAQSWIGTSGNGALAIDQYLQKALNKMRVRDYSGALMDATAAIDAERKNAGAWTLRSEIDNQLSNFRGAISDAGEALKLAPSSAQALRAKAYAEIETGDFGSALTDIQRAIEVEPDNGVGYLYRAIAEEKMGRPADALKDYDKADDIDPSLTPLTAEAFKRLGAGYDTATSKPTPLPVIGVRSLFREGTAALAVALVVLGLAGAAAGKKLTTTAKRLLNQNAAEEATVLDAAPASIGVGTILSKNYHIKGELGRGGMGVVYDAFDETLQRRVAIKQLQRDERTTSQDMDRFLQEARLVAQLKHPRLAEIYTVINEGDQFLVFEYVEGQPLDKILSLNRKLPISTARKLIADVAAALDYAHGRKIIHRDLKPSNIMVENDGTAKVMDFGIAHQSQTATALTRTGASGTPPYMAPEQSLGSVSKASDLYALAVMTYEMLTGVRPFEGPDFLEQKLRKVYQPPSARDSELPSGLDGFFSAAFEPDPTKRPSSAGEFLRDFDRACGASVAS